MKSIGTCSECGGAVTVPEFWRGIGQPTPECSKCGAVAETCGPVIPMKRKDNGTRAMVATIAVGLLAALVVAAESVEQRERDSRRKNRPLLRRII